MGLEQVDKERLARITDFFESELCDLRDKFQQLDSKSYLSNRDIRRNVERCLENIINASLDAAKIILVSNKLPIPDTYREYFVTLYIANLIDKDTADKLSDGVRLRNVLAHQYLDIRWDRINKFLKGDWEHYEKFLSFLKDCIEEQY